MIDRLFDVFRDLVGETPADDAVHDDSAIQLAAAGLMIEVARSDTTHQQVELAVIENVLLNQFDVASHQVEELISAAGEQVEAAHDLYQFTRLINEHFNREEKQQLILAMWLVAFADGHIEAIEDHIIRRVAGLIHLAHEDFIRLKIEARDLAN